MAWFVLTLVIFGVILKLCAFICCSVIWPPAASEKAAFGTTPLALLVYYDQCHSRTRIMDWPLNLIEIYRPCRLLDNGLETRLEVFEVERCITLSWGGMVIDRASESSSDRRFPDFADLFLDYGLICHAVFHQE